MSLKRSLPLPPVFLLSVPTSLPTHYSSGVQLGYHRTAGSLGARAPPSPAESGVSLSHSSLRPWHLPPWSREVGPPGYTWPLQSLCSSWACGTLRGSDQLPWTWQSAAFESRRTRVNQLLALPITRATLCSQPTSCPCTLLFSTSEKE